MACDFQIVEMAAGDIEGELAFVVADLGGVNCDARYELVGGDHVEDVEIFDGRAGVTGVAVVAVVEAAADFNVGSVKGDHALELELFNAVLAASAICSEDSSGLRWDDVAEGAFNFSGEAVGRSLIHPLRRMTRALRHFPTPWRFLDQSGRPVDSCSRSFIAGVTRRLYYSRSEQDYTAGGFLANS